MPTKPSEVLQVLIDKTLDPKEAPVYQQYAKIMSWADKYRRLKIRTNADQPDQARNAVAFGAEGIGLCRTEHMFFGEGKIGPMREMILADTVEERKAALAKLLPLQRTDFEGIFEAMNGRPVTIRTIDPPLHEFVPHEEAAQRELAAADGHQLRESASACGGPARIQPDARLPRMPSGDHFPGDHGDAVARNFRSGRERAGEGHQGRTRRS